MSVRKRKYSNDFLKWGFTDIVIAGVERPQCVICLEVLAHQSMKPAKLQRHLETKHPALKDKGIDFLKQKLMVSKLPVLIAVIYFKTKI